MDGRMEVVGCDCHLGRHANDFAECDEFGYGWAGLTAAASLWRARGYASHQAWARLPLWILLEGGVGWVEERLEPIADFDFVDFGWSHAQEDCWDVGWDVGWEVWDVIQRHGIVAVYVCWD